MRLNVVLNMCVMPSEAPWAMAIIVQMMIAAPASFSAQFQSVLLMSILLSPFMARQTAGPFMSTGLGDFATDEDDFVVLIAELICCRFDFLFDV